MNKAINKIQTAIVVALLIVVFIFPFVKSVTEQSKTIVLLVLYACLLGMGLLEKLISKKPMLNPQENSLQSTTENDQQTQIKQLEKFLGRIEFLFIISTFIYIVMIVVFYYLHIDGFMISLTFVIVFFILSVFQYRTRMKMLHVKNQIESQIILVEESDIDSINDAALYTLDLIIEILFCLTFFVYVNLKYDIFDDSKYGFSLLIMFLYFLLIIARSILSKKGEKKD